MDGELAVVSNGLDVEDPRVSAPKAPTDRTGEADVIARIDVVVRYPLSPARIKPHPFALDHGRVKVGFEQTCACPPDVEITVPARFEQKEDADEKTYQYHG